MRDRPGDAFATFVGHILLASVSLRVLGWTGPAIMAAAYAVGWLLNRDEGG